MMPMERRPIKARGADWAKGLARSLAGLGVSPNAISLMSIGFAFLSALFFILSRQTLTSAFLIFAALSIQLRLICNLMDGMVAVEHAKKTRSGDIYNDAPDRVADAFILIGLGYAIPDSVTAPYAVELGYVAAILAIMTAYIRVLGASLTQKHFFLGPMAKPHRMALVTIVCVLEVLKLSFFNQKFSLLYLGLWILVLGSVLTCFRRLGLIIAELEGRSS